MLSFLDGILLRVNGLQFCDLLVPLELICYPCVGPTLKKKKMCKSQQATLVLSESAK